MPGFEFDFTGQVVVVTGSAGNLGQAVTRAFHRAGATMVCFDRSGGKLKEIFPELAAAGEHFLPALSVDVTDADSVEEAFRVTVERFGRIDALMHTVGGYRAGRPLHETPVEDWDLMVSLNARSVFVTNRAVVPHMLARGSGTIVNVAARAGLAGESEAGPYSATKSAAIRLTETIAAELRGTGIHVNAVLPGTIDTPENRAAAPGADTTSWVTPEAIADVCLFLSSDAARAISGAAIPVYGPR